MTKIAKATQTLNDLRDSRLLYEKKLPSFGYMIILITTVLLIGIFIWSLFTPKVYIVKGSGIVESLNKNYIMPAYSGEVNNITIQNGDHVQEGDILFAIKSTDLDLQKAQVDGKVQIYEKQIAQLEKLEQAVRNGRNPFNPNDPADKQYYNQYQAYKAQTAQNIVDIEALKKYEYTEEQIAAEIEKNDNKNAEIYHSTLKSIAESLNAAKAEMENLKIQSDTLKEGQSEYTVTARTSGIVHLNADYKNGMVVQAGSIVGSIAAENDTYIIKASINVNDMPRVETGNSVDISVPGLLESVYGTIPGELVHIDSDVSQIGGGAAGSGGSQGQENVGESGAGYFKLEIKPGEDYLISKSGRKYTLSNGTVVETRIKYEEVTYFIYFMESLGLFVR